MISAGQIKRLKSGPRILIGGLFVLDSNASDEQAKPLVLFQKLQEQA